MPPIPNNNSPQEYPILHDIFKKANKSSIYLPLTKNMKTTLSNKFKNKELSEQEVVQKTIWARNVLMNQDPKYSSLRPETRIVMVELCLKRILNTNESIEVLARTVSKLFPKLDQDKTLRHFHE